MVKWLSEKQGEKIVKKANETTANQHTSLG